MMPVPAPQRLTRCTVEVFTDPPPPEPEDPGPLTKELYRSQFGLLLFRFTVYST